MLPEQLNVALRAIEDRYAAEQSLMEAVAAGKTNEASRRYQHFISYRLTPPHLLDPPGQKTS